MSVDLRNGQKALKEYVEANASATKAVCQFPTGYGKTLCIAIAYATRRMQRACNRLMVVVANSNQLNQAMYSIPGAMKLVGAKCGSVRKFTDEAHIIKSVDSNHIEVLATTIQMVSSCANGDSKSRNSLVDILDKGGKWMIAADEFHHYGQGKTWGKSLQLLTSHSNTAFCLALSATPYRDAGETIFGDVTPGLRVTYKQAIGENAVKPFQRCKFEYDLKLADGTMLRASDIREGIERYGSFTQYEAKAQLRYNPDYCVPLIREPAERLIKQRKQLEKKVQMLVRAASCEHAKYIATSLKAHFKGLSVDWVGGGEDGRENEGDGKKNEQIINEFRPSDGSEPRLDVLVQVGMASEGFDSVYVTEIVDFALVTLEGNANQTKQFIGRGSRVIPGCEGIPCYVNIGHDHPMASAPWSLNDWIDSGENEELPPCDDDQQEDREWYDDWTFVPENIEYTPVIESVELHHIDIESEDFRTFVRERNVHAAGHYKEWDINDPACMEIARKAYATAAKKENEPLREEQERQYMSSRVESLRSKFARAYVQQKMRLVSNRSLPKSRRSDREYELAVMAKKAFASQLKKEFGGSKKEMTAEELKRQAQRAQEWCEVLNAGGNLSWL